MAIRNGAWKNMKLRWNNNESHDMMLLHGYDSVQLPGWEPSVPILKPMFMKLKKGKASPDGITAEVLQNLPGNQVAKLDKFMKVIDNDPLMPLPAELRV